MIIFPAVDIKQGQAVRLQQGQADKVTVFHNDPVSLAKYWQDLGATYLHVVDLDGAFQGEARSYKIVEQICASVDMSVQLGGGIRDEETVAQYLNAGVTRVILGTIALENYALFADLCTKFKGKIGVSLDSDHGVLKTRGWVNNC